MKKRKYKKGWIKDSLDKTVYHQAIEHNGHYFLTGRRKKIKRKKFLGIF